MTGDDSTLGAFLGAVACFAVAVLLLAVARLARRFHRAGLARLRRWHDSRPLAYPVRDPQGQRR